MTYFRVIRPCDMNAVEKAEKVLAQICARVPPEYLVHGTNFIAECPLACLRIHVNPLQNEAEERMGRLRCRPHVPKGGDLARCAPDVETELDEILEPRKDVY